MAHEDFRTGFRPKIDTLHKYERKRADKVGSLPRSDIDSHWLATEVLISEKTHSFVLTTDATKCYLALIFAQVQIRRVDMLLDACSVDHCTN